MEIITEVTLMDTEPEVVTDPLMECSYRYDHRDAEGIIVNGRRVCPLCIEAATIE